MGILYYSIILSITLLVFIVGCLTGGLVGGFAFVGMAGITVALNKLFR